MKEVLHLDVEITANYLWSLGAGSDWNEVISASVMNTKQWHHIAAVINNGSMSIYVDGLEAANGTYPGSPTQCELPFLIGESAGFPGRIFDGIIDELRVWNIARTANQIADNKTTEFTGTEPGLIAYFPMNEGSGSTVGNQVDANCSGATVEMDDNNWVDGYRLPDYDVSVKSIRGIDRIQMSSRPVRINTEVQNVGTNPISEVEASIDVDGELVVTETIAMTLEAGEAIKYNFNTPIYLGESDDPTITVSVSHPDDSNALNDVATTQIVTKGDDRISILDAVQHNLVVPDRFRMLPWYCREIYRNTRQFYYTLTWIVHRVVAIHGIRQLRLWLQMQRVPLR